MFTVHVQPILIRRAPHKYDKLHFYSPLYTAERIELWIHYSTRGAPTTPSSQLYEFLGFIALSDNSATNYKSRELQSVPVGPKKGTHLKLRLGSPHQNDMNKSTQVVSAFTIEFQIEIKPINLSRVKNSTGCTNCNQCTRRVYVDGKCNANRPKYE